MKTTNGLSLNEVLHPGPKLQVDLHPLLIRFMSHQVAMSADIWKFYPQTHVNHKHRDFQRFLWREMPQEPLKVCRMTRLTFGLTCAPFLAIRALHQLADSHSTEFPRATQVIKEEFLVDNLLSGARNVEEALDLQKQVTQVLSRGNLKLTRWTSNNCQVLKSIPKELLDSSVSLDIFEGENQVVRTIGIMWKPKQDTFQVSVSIPEPSIISTKRSVLSTIARTFDPLGWLSPVTVRPKILMQAIWSLKLDWDQPLPVHIHTQWRKYTEELPLLHNFHLNRNICQPPHPSSAVTNFELQGFSDGSNVAYSACVYVKAIDEEGRVSTKLVTAKTKVTPIKKQSTPRSELCSAVLLCNLLDTVKKALHHVTFVSTNCWSDSTVVLGRLSEDKKLPIFELNRVRKIISSLPAIDWAHVKGDENPADCASRGISALELLQHPLWLHGPPGLYQKVNKPEESEESTPNLVSIPPGDKPLTRLIESCSSFCRMRRIVAYCLSFISNSKVQDHPRTKLIPSMRTPRVQPISVAELDQALITIIKLVQFNAFSSEIAQLKENPEVSPPRFRSLAPFIDEVGVLRVNHNFVVALIRFYHFKGLHAGPSLLMSLLRDRFWILAGLKTIKKIIGKCTMCFRHTAVPMHQLMGKLPSSRVTKTHPFQQCGIDYAAPFHLSLRTGRKPPKVKSYVCLFVCMATKAIHLEYVTSLTSDAFTAALHRFISRRGKPADIFCDGGTNFLGTKIFLGELNEIQEFLNSNKHQTTMIQATANNGIQFHVNPPHAPHHGGLWEAGVKSMKRHLNRVMGNQSLTVEEFQTLLCQVEATLNSRPLTPLSSDPKDMSVLTPGHFLVGRPLLALPQRDVSNTKQHPLDRWQLVQQLTQHFWKRWSSEYLSLLHSRPKWLKTIPNLEIGMLVLLRDDDASFTPNLWKLGRIVQVYTGQDGKVRVCDVYTNINPKTGKGTILKRPIVKLIPLPFYD